MTQYLWVSWRHKCRSDAGSGALPRAHSWGRRSSWRKRSWESREFWFDPRHNERRFWIGYAGTQFNFYFAFSPPPFAFSLKAPGSKTQTEYSREWSFLWDFWARSLSHFLSAARFQRTLSPCHSALFAAFPRFSTTDLLRACLNSRLAF